jgi:SAM-dependent methyltransferase
MQLAIVRAVSRAPLGAIAKQCNLCDRHVSWFVDGRCAFCGSLPRHRLIVYTLKQTPLSVGSTIVHLGAIKIERDWVEAQLRPVTYHRVDILPSADANLVADATKLPLPEASADVAIAWHVLEHIPRDHDAIAEIFRVLRPGGNFFVSVPIHPKGRIATFEDSETPAADRERVYGFHEHVRACGTDYGDRLVGAGFDVITIAIDTCPHLEVERFGLSRGHVAWVCRKP